MLEVKTLRSLRIPNPARLEPKAMSQVERLVDAMMANPSDRGTQLRLDRIVADFCGLTSHECKEVGLEF